jgi:hypothetical protein
VTFLQSVTVSAGSTGGLDIFKAIGYVAAAITFILGLIQYWQAQRWKRAEFIANETKEFFANPLVKNALMMIDWAQRKIPLSISTNLADPTTWPVVTRETQCLALRHHSETPEQLDAISSGAGNDLTGFTAEQAAIRDSFDAFLNGLDRFGALLSTGLIKRSDLEPYMGYWVSDIVAPAANPVEAEWSARILAYIHLYGFDGVKRLFAEFGHKIDPNGQPFQQFMAGTPATSRAQIQVALNRVALAHQSRGANPTALASVAASRRE